MVKTNTHEAMDLYLAQWEVYFTCDFDPSRSILLLCSNISENTTISENDTFTNVRYNKEFEYQEWI